MKTGHLSAWPSQRRLATEMGLLHVAAYKGRRWTSVYTLPPPKEGHTTPKGEDTEPEQTPTSIRRRSTKLDLG